MRRISRIIYLVLVLAMAACATLPRGSERGSASWYGAELQGRRTASGERFDRHLLTAAHRTLPFGTRVRVRNVANGKEVIVRINDRGPFTGGRIVDVSQEAARRLDMIGVGEQTVELEVVPR